MQSRIITIAGLSLSLFASGVQAQGDAINADVIDRFLKGRAAEQPELEKVGTQLAELEDKIKKWNECAKEVREVAGGGIKGKIALKAKCSDTSDEGMRKERARLLESPERVGSAAAGMSAKQYAAYKEKFTGYVQGSRSFGNAELTAMNARAGELASALGLSLAQAGGEDRGGGGGGIGGRVAGALGVNMRAFTPDMTWVYVTYLWSIMYLSGATMFETAYKPGEWTKWEIKDSSQPENSTMLERALLSREADGSEWWRIKTISASPQSADTITLETQFKKADESGMVMNVVRMRGKLPGDTEGKELMVPQNLQTLMTGGAFGMQPTAESIAGATVGTETINAGNKSFSAKHVRFGSGGGNMNWWLADNAPGRVVKVEFNGQDKDQKWIMQMTGSGTGAKSELGIK